MCVKHDNASSFYLLEVLLQTSITFLSILEPHKALLRTKSNSKEEYNTEN